MGFLEDYAKLLLGPAGVNAEDEVEIWSADPKEPLVVAVCEAADAAGTLATAPELVGAHATTTSAAILLISPETHPMGGRGLQMPLGRDGNWRRQYTAAPLPTAAWAKALFPDATPEHAREQLQDALALALRLDEKDPAAYWLRRHDELAERARALNGLAATALRFSGEGCELSVPLTPESRWIAPRCVARETGRPFSPNMPCEEVFTAPAGRELDGTVRCDVPWHLHTGGVPAQVEITFRPGRDPLAAPEFAPLADPGCNRVGEIALVDEACGVRRAGIEFGDVVTAENGACHLALGNPIPGSGGRPAPGVPHHDLPIAGTLSVEAETGYRWVPILDRGRWVL